MRMTIAAAICVLATGQALAQDNDWRFAATAYVWLPTTGITVDTPRGSVSGELSVEDAIKNLDFALMGTFEARRDRLVLLADLVYFDLSADQSTPFGGLFDTATVDNQITGLTMLAAWRVRQSDSFTLDVGAGARLMWVNVDVTLSGGALPTETSNRNDNWIDPIVALRARADFDERWFGTLYLDAGGFGVGSEETYQAAATVGYHLNDRWSLQGGWRYLDFRRKNDGNTLDFDQSGFVFGATYRF